MKRFARIAGIAAATIGMTFASLSGATATAATGDMNEVIKINDTPTLVKNVYEYEIQDQFAFLDSNLPFENVTGVAGERPPFAIVISLSKMEGLRTQSHLAPLASIAASAALYVGTPKSGELPDLSTAEPTLALPDETTACIAAAATGTIIDDHKVIVTDADIAAMHDAIAAEFDLAPADVITKAFWRGYVDGYAACGVDTSLI